MKVETATETYYEFSDHPLAEVRSVAEVEAYDWPDLDWWDYSAVPDLIERMNARDRRAVLFMAGGAFETPWYMCGMEKFLTELHLARRSLRQSVVTWRSTTASGHCESSTRRRGSWKSLARAAT